MGSVAINKSVEPVRNQVFDAAHITMIRCFFLRTIPNCFDLYNLQIDIDYLTFYLLGWLYMVNLVNIGISTTYKSMMNGISYKNTKVSSTNQILPRNGDFPWLSKITVCIQWNHCWIPSGKQRWPLSILCKWCFNALLLYIYIYVHTYRKITCTCVIVIAMFDYQRVFS